MLQWMGGSRRKVTASRKSTQKRQKQYFEQRRRQQQHQPEAADGGNYFEGNRTYGQQSEKNRSLDILSLLNLSAVAEEHKSGCPMARGKSEDDAVNYLTLQHLPVARSNDIKTQEHSEIEEARASSSYQMGIACTKVMSVSAPGNHAETVKTDGDKMNQLKMDLDCQPSVIDILEDDEPSSGCLNSLSHEAHVAFSIKGLGKVETETPVHSPLAESRSCLHGCSSPSKATKLVNPSKDLTRRMVNLEHELDAMMWDIDSAFCRSAVGQPFCSKKSVNSFSKLKQKIDFEEFSLFNDSENSLHDLIGDDELFYGSKESIRNASGSLADDILHESGLHLSDKNWMDAMDTSADFLNSVNFRSQQFERCDQPEKRTTMRKEGKIGFTESPGPNFKYQKLENVSGFTPADMTWHSPFGRDHGDRNDEFGESCLRTDDVTESLSLPSEESCSSTAERGKSALSNLKDKLAMRDQDDIFHLQIGCSKKDVSPSERNCNKWKTPLKEQMYMPGKFTSISSPEVAQLHSTHKKRLKPEHSRYFEAQYDLGVQSSDCSSFFETSGTTNHVSPGCRLWTEDVFHTIGDAELESNRSRLERLSKSSANCSPGCNFASETHDCCQPNMQNMSGSSIQNIFQVSALGDKSHKPLDVHGCLTPKKENIARLADGNSGVQSAIHRKLQPLRNELSGSKSLSSSNGKSTGASDSQIECRDCKEPTCETLNTGESENKMNCFQKAEDMPSFETSNIRKGKQCNVDTKCQFSETSVSSETGLRDVEVDGQPKQRRMGYDANALSTAGPTCQVMMFDNRVLQLLCVQVLKEVSLKVTGYKAYE